MAYFQSQLPQRSKLTALSVMAFYVGLDLSEAELATLTGIEEGRP